MLGFYSVTMKRMVFSILIVSGAALAGFASAAAAPDTNSCRQQDADDTRTTTRRPLLRPLTETGLIRKKDRCRARRILM
jgi:hypothetical protein